MPGYWQLYGIVIGICTYELMCKYPYSPVRNLSLPGEKLRRRYDLVIRRIRNHHNIRYV